jgi:hypothetical protein
MVMVVTVVVVVVAVADDDDDEDVADDDVCLEWLRSRVYFDGVMMVIFENLLWGQ